MTYLVGGGTASRAGRVPFTTRVGLTLKQALEHRYVMRERNPNETTCYWLKSEAVAGIVDADLFWQDMYAQLCRNSRLMNRMLDCRTEWSKRRQPAPARVPEALPYQPVSVHPRSGLPVAPRQARLCLGHERLVSDVQHQHDLLVSASDNQNNLEQEVPYNLEHTL